MRNINSKGVLLNAKIQSIRYRKSDEWLQKGVEFNNGYYLSGEYRETATNIFNKLGLGGGYKDSCKRKDFECLLANLLECRLRRPLSISRNRNNWVNSQYNSITYFIIECMNALEENELIEMTLGYNNKEQKEKSRNTRIWLTDKLLQHFPIKREHIHWQPVNLVELREFKSKKKKSYRKTKLTERIRSILQKTNKVNTNADILLFDNDKSYRLSPFLTAIYKGDFEHYGRLHVTGYRHNYQAFSEAKRAELLINDEQVIELDFKALHPYLLYASEGIQYIGDPYAVVDSRPLVRSYLKKILLCMLNSENVKQAEAAANRIFYEPRTAKEKRTKELLNKMNIYHARPLMHEFENHHKAIAHYFYSGKKIGLKIMNTDSKIAIDVLEYFSNKDIPILPIHDSFIIQANFKDELQNIMKKMYRKRTGFRCVVK